MKIINIKDLREGMVIAEDIYSLDRDILVKEGRIIDLDSKKVLSKNDISKVKVYTTKDNKEINRLCLLEKYKVNNLNDLTERIENNLKERFSVVKNSKLMMKILDETIKYELKSMEIEK